MFIGTLQYVSPEQASGGVVDQRSDIFSFGVVLYEMLSGKNPFAASTFFETARQIAEKRPEPIGQSPELNRIVMKCLEKNPERRYQSARKIQRDLEEIGQPAETRKSPLPLAGVALAIVAIVVAVILLWPRKAAALTQRDTVLLADFANRTTDPVFDRTLRDALAVELGQSPFLNLFPESGIRQTLQYMGRSPDEHLTPPIAREICQRQGIKAFLSGSVAPLGSRYVLTLAAQNGQTGDVLVQEQIEADRKENVLGSLGSAATKIRRELGESLKSVERFDAPIEQATTSSLEALHLFSLGNQQFFAGKFREAIPFYQRATDADRNFAMAYARLATAYYNSLENDLAAETSA